MKIIKTIHLHGTLLSKYQYRHYFIRFSHQSWEASQLSIIISTSQVGTEGMSQNHTANFFGQIWPRLHEHLQTIRRYTYTSRGTPLSHTCKSPVLPSRPLDTLRHTEPQQTPRPLARAQSVKRGNGKTRGKRWGRGCRGGRGVQVSTWGASRR